MTLQIVPNLIRKIRSMIINRPFWQNLLENAWLKKNIIWLMGVRRLGKTSLCLSMPNIEYFDCESPRIRHFFVDPEGFLESNRGKRIILDEIHRLDNATEILKIAADHYKDVKIIATGSSTLGASNKFKDTLTGRKKVIWLTPILHEELGLFRNHDIHHRFLFGGFPGFFEQTKLPEEEFREWIDSYWAKDVHELFKIGKRASFLKFVELLLAYSGGIFEASKFADACEVSRQTILEYLDILHQTFIISIIRPFSTHKPSEIVKSPKVYGMDTGFTCYFKGWRELRKSDQGLLWEQYVLNELHGKLQRQAINYWRDKKGHEIDFILNQRPNDITAIECKFSILEQEINNSNLTTIVKNFEIFRKNYPQGQNLVVAYDIGKSFERKYNNLTINFVNPADLIKKLQEI